MEDRLRSFTEPVYDSSGEEVDRELPVKRRRVSEEGGGASASSSSSTRRSTGLSGLATLQRAKEVKHEAVVQARTAEASARSAEYRLLCVVCKERERGIVLVPCSHFTLCTVCAPDISECPVCRTDVQERRRMVIS